MSVFVDRDSKVIIQGFTGQHATFHAEEAMSFGTKVVGGVTPGKGGTTHLGLPVFNSVAEAVEETGADVSRHLRAAGARHGLPAGGGRGRRERGGDHRRRRARAGHGAAPSATWPGRSTRIIGPNSPGIITPGECKVGIMPSHIY